MRTLAWRLAWRQMYTVDTKVKIAAISGPTMRTRWMPTKAAESNDALVSSTPPAATSAFSHPPDSAYAVPMTGAVIPKQCSRLWKARRYGFVYKKRTKNVVAMSCAMSSFV